MEFRQAKEEEISQIVNIHKKAFNGFFLTKLGDKFLAELYLNFLIREHGILRVAINKNKIVGFAAGTTEPEFFFKKLRKNRALYFILYAIPGLIKNPLTVTKKLFYAAFYKGDTSKNLLNSTLLSSIGVSPEASGKSVGKNLLLDFEKQASLNNKDIIFLTTDKNNNEKVINFYKKNNYTIESFFKSSGNREMLRFMKKI